MYLVALHDVGKADPLFQNKNEELARSLRQMGFELPEETAPFRHEWRSAQWAMAHLRKRHRWGREAAVVAAGALRGHHGDFQPRGNREDKDEPARFQLWESMRDDLAGMVAQTLGVSPFALDHFEDASAVGIQLAGITVLSDWIASNHELYHYPGLARSLSPGGYFAAARQEGARAVGRLAFGQVPQGEAAMPVFREVWPTCATLRPSQQALEEACLAGVSPGLAIIEAPMGEGKTEGAIYLAECWNRITRGTGVYIALPTQATSNQMYARYATFLQSRGSGLPAPRLVHGMAWLVDDIAPVRGAQTYGGDTAGSPAERRLSWEWFQNAKRALLAPNGVGTVDQALLASLHVRHGFLRLFGLSSKILVIDEAHAYDEYMSTLMERLLHWCSALRIPVILLSATLSRSQKRRLAEAYAGEGALPPASPEGEPYPLLTFVPLEGKPRCVAVERSPQYDRRIALRACRGLLDDPEGIARLAADLVRQGGCACVLANTVAAAQQIFNVLLRQEPPHTALYLFHARFRAERRQEIEQEVVARFGKAAGTGGLPDRPKRAILVATQVVEQSLDVDFDVMISQIAPVDLLLQRAGRLWRHDRGRRPTGDAPALHVLLPAEGSLDFGPTDRVYDLRAPLLRTLALLQGREEFHLPADFRPLVEGCYGDLPVPDGTVPAAALAEAEQWRRDKLAEARAKAREHLIPEPNREEFALAHMPEAPVMEDEDGSRRDYFHAQTRLGGEQTSPALVLHDPDLVELARAEAPPDREAIRRLFLQKVSLPAWWLKGLSPVQGFEQWFPGPEWLSGHIVIPMRQGKWQGRDSKGKLVTIADDPVLGMDHRVEGD
jgi:CRISPR-associated endonuclease/helicase Cas3